jgi:hypothetical protein
MQAAAQHDIASGIAENWSPSHRVDEKTVPQWLNTENLRLSLGKLLLIKACCT